ncbi:hypothetical protein DSCW_26740 [Desulfosarcina widdelii]|uniref:SH3b domain-containing protein n=1 Tax=Desulfosarcina widdelii TaxID=947919 RepID=A0A5K7ZGM9_9BACT|nr:DUF6515 family protein [Desulfosarcina widdelii]BBO75257.1 hypothetical protein DSCW_26740 [Desulfosarcina widdelii]
MQRKIVTKVFKRLVLMMAVHLLVFTTIATVVYAQPGRGPGHGPGEVLHKMPPDHRTVNVGNSRYYFHGGAFYQQRPGGFFPVHAPVGAVVFSLPVGAMALLVGGITYYLYNDVYYRRAQQGYVVVEQPSEVVAVKETSAVVPSQQITGETVTITAALLNVRSGPGLNFPVVQQIRQHETVAINGYAPEWLYVQLPDGSFGWVMLKYTSAFDSNAAG